MKREFKGIMVSVVICMVFCMLINAPVLASEESTVSDDTYNQLIREQMEKVVNTIEGNEIEAVKVDPKNEMMCLTEKANVRSGPDTSYESLGMIEKDTNIMVSGITENNWYQTSYQGNVAYVLGDYLKSVEVEAGLSQEMSQQVEEVIEAVEEDVAAMQMEESIQAIEEKVLKDQKTDEKENVSFRYIIFGILIISGGSLLVLRMIKNKGHVVGETEIEVKKKFDIDGMDVVSFDEEE